MDLEHSPHPVVHLCTLVRSLPGWIQLGMPLRIFRGCLAVATYSTSWRYVGIVRWIPLFCDGWMGWFPFLGWKNTQQKRMINFSRPWLPWLEKLPNLRSFGSHFPRSAARHNIDPYWSPFHQVQDLKQQVGPAFLRRSGRGSWWGVCGIMRKTLDMYMMYSTFFIWPQSRWRKNHAILKMFRKFWFQGQWSLPYYLSFTNNQVIVWQVLPVLVCGNPRSLLNSMSISALSVQLKPRGLDLALSFFCGRWSLSFSKNWNLHGWKDITYI